MASRGRTASPYCWPDACWRSPSWSPSRSAGPTPRTCGWRREAVADPPAAGAALAQHPRPWPYRRRTAAAHRRRHRGRRAARRGRAGAAPRRRRQGRPGHGPPRRHRLERPRTRQLGTRRRADRRAGPDAQPRRGPRQPSAPGRPTRSGPTWTPRCSRPSPLSTARSSTSPTAACRVPSSSPTWPATSAARTWPGSPAARPAPPSPTSTSRPPTTDRPGRCRSASPRRTPPRSTSAPAIGSRSRTASGRDRGRPDQRDLPTRGQRRPGLATRPGATAPRARRRRRGDHPVRRPAVARVVTGRPARRRRGRTAAHRPLRTRSRRAHLGRHRGARQPGGQAQGSLRLLDRPRPVPEVGVAARHRPARRQYTEQRRFRTGRRPARRGADRHGTGPAARRLPAGPPPYPGAERRPAAWGGATRPRCGTDHRVHSRVPVGRRRRARARPRGRSGRLLDLGRPRGPGRCRRRAGVRHPRRRPRQPRPAPTRQPGRSALDPGHRPAAPRRRGGRCPDRRGRRLRHTAPARAPARRLRRRHR